MPTEWLRVMMEEVERKRREALAARVEARQRSAKALAGAKAATQTSPAR